MVHVQCKIRLATMMKPPPVFWEGEGVEDYLYSLIRIKKYSWYKRDTHYCG